MPTTQIEIPKRDLVLADLAQRINQEHAAADTAGSAFLAHARAAGELLLQVKEQLGHGQFMPWVQEHFAGKARTARAYMQLARHWPQIEAKWQRDATLSYRQAVKLLAPPAATPESELAGYQTKARAEIAALEAKRQELFAKIDRGDLAGAEALLALKDLINEAQDAVNRYAYRGLCNLLQFAKFIKQTEKAKGLGATDQLVRQAGVSLGFKSYLKRFCRCSQDDLDHYAELMNARGGEISREGFWRWIASDKIDGEAVDKVSVAAD